MPNQSRRQHSNNTPAHTTAPLIALTSTVCGCASASRKRLMAAAAACALPASSSSSSLCSPAAPLHSYPAMTGSREWGRRAVAKARSDGELIQRCCVRAAGVCLQSSVDRLVVVCRCMESSITATTHAPADRQHVRPEARVQ